MNFTQAVASVIGKVKRPDKQSMAQQEVNAALLFYLSRVDHSRCLVEGVFTGTLGYTHSIPLSSMPRFRKLDWLKYPNIRAYVRPLDTRELGCNDDIRDKWYLSGDAIQVNLARETATLQYSYYKHPPFLSDTSPDYWFLEDHWPMIVEKATSVIFNDIGDADSSRKAEALAEGYFTIFQGDLTRGTK